MNARMPGRRHCSATFRTTPSTFVVTDAYRQAARAVEYHGFCLLIGEHSVGKSVIAATLAMTAIDRWDSLVIRADGPAEIVARWYPHEPGQFFWVDDAFGALRHEEDLTELQGSPVSVGCGVSPCA
jgi:hypothetical protein